MPWSTDGKFWIGRHESRGLVVIPKTSMSANSRSFRVYFVEQNRAADCNAEIMRKFTTGNGISPEEVNSALQAFLGLGDGEIERREEEARRRNEEIALNEKKLEDKNKLFLEQQGVAFAGTRRRSDSLKSRVTHCYSCKNNLSSSVNLECIACGWIICQCGACGCAYAYS